MSPDRTYSVVPTVVAAVTSDSQDGLVVQCDDKDTLDIAYLSPGTKSELDTMSQDGSAVPAELFVKVNQGGVQKLDAVMKQWNNKYLGFVASGRTPDMVAVVKAIGAANNHISIGVEIAGEKQAKSFDAAGSTSAMSTVIKDCKLDAIKAYPEGDSGSVK